MPSKARQDLDKTMRFVFSYLQYQTVASFCPISR